MQNGVEQDGVETLASGGRHRVGRRRVLRRRVGWRHVEPRQVGRRHVEPRQVGRRRIQQRQVSCWLAVMLLLPFPVSAGVAGAAPVAPSAASASQAAPGRYRAPTLPLVVLHRFAPPAHRYGAGKVGVDLQAATGSAVASAGAGTVVFAGPVAGRGVVVVAHPDGIRTEYEPLRPAVVVGQRVVIGTRLGMVDGHHIGCAGACLHWGARRGTVYIDPLSLLRPLGPVRLLPWPP